MGSPVSGTKLVNWEEAAVRVPGAALLLMKRRFEIAGHGIAGERHILDIALLHLLKEAGVRQVDRRLSTR